LKNPTDFLNHIKDECEYLIKTSEKLNYETFIKNETIRRAFVRSLEVIGEASKSIPEDFKKTYQNIEWRKIAGMRDVLIHHYFGVSYKTVWDVINNNIPSLLEGVKEILKKEQQS
jgi:uncharacterized protein with HEPN domain